jgi:acetyltransferase-like isoleucine patch superfamily enzyme
MLRTMVSRILQRHRVEGMWHRGLWVASGAGTYIDPGVIVDQPERIHIGSNCVIRKGVVLRPEGGEIVIGDNCVINHYSVFHARGGICIGDWSIIAPHCGFYAQNHSFDRFDMPIAKQANVGLGIYLMGDNWIGGHAVLCDDVTLGKGAVVGANATVTRSVPMAKIALGTPARPLGARYEGEWDFQKVERAAAEGLPADIAAHVANRAKRVCEFIAPNDHVLEIGCGEGTMAKAIGDVAPHFEGCDYSETALVIARQRCPRLSFWYSNATNIRSKDAQFSKVVMCDVAEHLMLRQFERALAEAARVLAPGGTLILTTPLTGSGKRGSTYAHIYEYSENELRRILRSSFARVDLLDKNLGLFAASGPVGGRNHVQSSDRSV